MTKTVKERIFSLIQKKGRGRLFFCQDFMPLYKRWEIDRSLADLEKEGKIFRIITGLYTYPQYSKLLNQYVFPDVGAVAQAIARKHDWIIFPEGNTALNYLGLSTQIPAKYIYLSSGRSRKYVVGGMDLVFKEANSNELAIRDKKTNMVVQAILSMGKVSAQNKEFIDKLSFCFSCDEWQKIETKAKKTNQWVFDIIRKAKEVADGKNN